jgi:hypothetical protein
MKYFYVYSELTGVMICTDETGTYCIVLTALYNSCKILILYIELEKAKKRVTRIPRSLSSETANS